MTKTLYWRETIADAACDCKLTLTDEQLDCLAKAVEVSHDCYGMAFYSPPATDRLSEIEKEWKAKYLNLEKEFNKYRDNAEMAVKIALKQHPTTNISIGEYGEVTRFGGRTDIIQ